MSRLATTSALTALLVGCSGSSGDTQVPQEPQRFTIIDHSTSMHQIVDTVTKCSYLTFQDEYHRGITVTPLLNSAGHPACGNAQ